MVLSGTLVQWTAFHLSGMMLCQDVMLIQVTLCGSHCMKVYSQTVCIPVRLCRSYLSTIDRRSMLPQAILAAYQVQQDVSAT